MQSDSGDVSGSAGTTLRDSYGIRWFSRAARDAFGNFRTTLVGAVGPTLVALAVSLVASDPADRVDAVSQLRWLLLGVIGSASIALLWFSVRLALTPSVLAREDRHVSLQRENELSARLHEAEQRVGSLQRQLEALPSLDIEVELHPDTIRALDDTAASRDAWLARELAAFQAALTRLKPPTNSAIASLNRDRRTPEDYLRSVRDYLSLVREQWPAVLASGAAPSGLGTTRVTVRNRATNFLDMQLRLTLPPNVQAAWEDTQWGVPEAPPLYGRDTIFNSIRVNPVFARLNTPNRGIIRSDRKSVVEFLPIQLHAGAYAELDLLTLIIPSGYAGSNLEVHWHAAARDIREPQTGSLTITVEETLIPAEQILAGISVT
jgi:hypothetical protein